MIMTTTTKRKNTRRQKSADTKNSDSMKYLSQLLVWVKWFLYGDNLAVRCWELASKFAKLCAFVFTVGLLVGDYAKPIMTKFREICLEQMQALKRRREIQLDEAIELAVSKTNN
jgi:hypothetical protein